MTRGEAIRLLRVECNLSLREVAAAAQLTHVRLGELERGVEDPTPELVAALAIVMARLVEPKQKARASRFGNQVAMGGKVAEIRAEVDRQLDFARVAAGKRGARFEELTTVKLPQPDQEQLNSGVVDLSTNPGYVSGWALQLRGSEIARVLVRREGLSEWKVTTEPAPGFWENSDEG